MDKTAMDILLFTLPALLGTFSGAALCVVFTRRVKLLWVLFAALYLAADTLILIFSPRLEHGQWNWSSKICSLLFALVVFFLFRLSRVEVGLVLPKDQLSWRWTLICIVGAVAFDGVLNYIFRTHQAPGLETIVYQATMPGLSEELTYRGISFALIQRAFSGAHGWWAKAAPALIPSLVFGLIHTYSPKNGFSYHEWSGFLFSLTLGLWFAWTRLRSGSLLGPIVAHNAANTAGCLIRGLR
ncbi:CPBP family intramembrane glutamic endopeptidase [Granulicella pectinivorans]|nr:CPBP family intramembrane glutamic endopeptidase [Granulicella pectinivorans]